MSSNNLSWTLVFITHLKRDLLINYRSLIDIIAIISFMLLIIILFTFGIGPIKKNLDIISNAIIWVGLILAIIPSLEKTLKKDLENALKNYIARGMKIYKKETIEI